MFLRGRLLDVVAALRRVPNGHGSLRAVIELAWAIPLMLLLGHFGGLIHLTIPRDASTGLVLAATLFLVPSLGEELLFRGFVIPLKSPNTGWQALSVLLFVLWHPLQAITIGPPWAKAFVDPWFLSVVAVLGICLARIYAASRSLWPPIVIHWLVVVGWKLFLGGPF